MNSCYEETMGDVMPKEDPPGKRKGLITWLKRLGIAGFLFFLLKGLAWVFFGAVLVKYFGCRG